MTPKQKKIYHELLLGKTYDQIAECMFISRETVKTHCRNIYKEYGVKNRKQLMAVVIINSTSESKDVSEKRS